MNRIQKVLFLSVLAGACTVPASAEATQLSGAKASSSYSATNPLSVIKTSAMSRKQAIASAKEYLASQAFSRKGLISQLKYEGFSTQDATYAVDHITVNWNTQAYKSAKEYLASQSFSKKGLYSQLIYEGFTASQAAYGVNKAYR